MYICTHVHEYVYTRYYNNLNNVTQVYDDVTYVYVDVTYVYDDVTYVYDDVTYVYTRYYNNLNNPDQQVCLARVLQNLKKRVKNS